MKNNLQVLLAVAFLSGTSGFAQSPVPEISFDSAADPLKFPTNIHLGEAAGVATNSKGDVFVYTRTGHPTISIGTARPFAHGGSRLFQFDKTGKFIREIGQDSYGFLVAQQVRIDPQDNIWVVDQMSSMVIKFDPNGQVQLLLGRKSESERLPTPPAAGPAGGRGAGFNPAPAGQGPPPGRGGRGGALPGAGQQSDVFQNGKFIKSWGSRGTENGQFSVVHGIAVDAQGNVYVADSGNKRIQVFDSDGTFKTQILNVGNPAAICITPGAHPYLYSSNSNPPEDIDADGEIYKIELSGKIIGKFGKAGKLPKEFGTVNAISCRSDNELYVGEIGNWRVQKLTLHAN
jgi:DNA-binding beta-propeller fold protein YncE